MTDSQPFITKDELRSRIRGQSAKKHIVYIFGAGASAGYARSLGISGPPVVKELFDPSNPLVRDVISRTQHKSVLENRMHYTREMNEHGGDLEAFLNFLYRTNPRNKTFSNLLVYLQDLFFEASNSYQSGGDNNYKELIRVMDTHFDWSNWSCVTFNYDTLFEKSYTEVDNHPYKSFDSIKGYSREPSILKVHGSTNFYHLFDEEVSAYVDTPKQLTPYFLFDEMMKNTKATNANIEVAEGYPQPFKSSFVDSTSKKTTYIMRYPFPLMLIPMHAEAVPENPFFKEMIVSAVENVMKADLVISIGYNFGDLAFIKELKKKKVSSEIILVGRAESHSILSTYRGYQNAQEVWGAENTKIFDGDGFSSFIDAII